MPTEISITSQRPLLMLLFTIGIILNVKSENVNLVGQGIDRVANARAFSLPDSTQTYRG